MKYKKVSLSKKRKIVEEAMAEKNITAVARRHGLSESIVSSWLSNNDINPDKEYARVRRENRNTSYKFRNKNQSVIIISVLYSVKATFPILFSF